MPSTCRDQMKRNIDLVQKELENENEESGRFESQLSESEDEEPRIKDILKQSFWRSV